MAKKIRISQCMIVKDEEANIRRALSWGKGIVWEQIVVDTGSTDRTVEIAKEMGAKVFHFEWCDDFSAAKNFAIEQASGNWIAFLDADEYFSKEDARKILRILKMIETSPYPKGMRPVSVRTTILNLGDKGTIASVAVHERIFRNQKNLRYGGAIHEALGDTSGHLHCYHDAIKDLTILHTGYMASVFKEKKKGERNVRLLEKEIEKNSQNYFARAYLGDTLTADRQDERALKVVEEVLENGIGKLPQEGLNMAFSDWFTLVSRMNPEKAKELREKTLGYYKKFQETGVCYPDIEYRLGYFFYRQQESDKAVSYFELALKKLDEFKDFDGLDMAGNLTSVYNILANYYDGMGWSDRVIYYVTLSLRTDRYQAKAVAVLLQLLQRDPGTTAAQAYDFLKKLYTMENPKDKLFLAQMAGVLRYEELEELLKSNMSAEELVMLAEMAGPGKGIEM